MIWRWLVLVVVFGLALARHAWADDGDAGSITLDLKTLAGLGTGLATIVGSAAAAAYRFWPRAPAPPAAPTYSAPTADAATLPPQPKPPSRTAIIREVKLEELQQRITELLPDLERVDWAALDNLGERLEHLERLIEKLDSPAD